MITMGKKQGKKGKKSRRTAQKPHDDGGNLDTGGRRTGTLRRVSSRYGRGVHQDQQVRPGPPRTDVRRVYPPVLQPRWDSLWLDEATTLMFARKSLAGIWASVAAGEFNPPLFYWLEHGMLFFGESEFVLRFLPRTLWVS